MNKAFTLIELLIYIGILALFLVSTVGFFWDIIFGNIKESSYQEIQENGRFALQKIAYEIRRAKSIISPLAGFSANSLSLEMADPNLSPTIFELEDGRLKITQGSNPSYFLTTDLVSVENLSFSNLSYEGTPGTIRVEIEISHLNPSGQIAFEASINLKSSFSLLPNQ